MDADDFSKEVPEDRIHQARRRKDAKTGKRPFIGAKVSVIGATVLRRTNYDFSRKKGKGYVGGTIDNSVSTKPPHR